ncbi:MAG: DUF2970 domain-containing protein [Gammaproteobacteria bacterium]|nr:DUF2970 domain-containing protein [Gammaproteobacteria bacterium]MBQ0838643.1 DUF2970 domain-containing protein [Gammaproteobacteria bacterium]
MKNNGVAGVGGTVDKEKPLTFLEVLGSTFAAAIGVQSKVNKKRDFTQGKPLQFILAGVIFATVFVVGVVAVVRTVLSSVA